MLVLAIAASPAAAQDQTPPKWDLFLGYQWTHPGGRVPNPALPSGPSIKPPDLGQGAGGAFTYDFTPHWGLEGDVGHDRNDFGYESTFSAGPRLMLRTPDMNFFVHALLGVNEFRISGLSTTDTGVGGILGGGMDLPLWKHVNIRLFEADYVLSHHNFAAIAPPGSDARNPNLNGARLRTGLVFNFGGAPAVPPAASCSLQPSEVMVGEPITATATASNFDPKHTLSYGWSSSGGKISGKDNTASIDTNGMSGGSYTVTAHVTDPRMKKGGEASCSATFAVKEPPKNPPTVSISSDPSSLQAGGTSNLSATCASPDSVPVSVGSWTASGGTVSGNGSSATLNTAGASAGPITVSATCTDSRGLTASASTQVTVEAPPPPPVNKELEARLALHSIYFPTAQPTVQKPDGGLLASQQQTLTELASDFLEYLKARPNAHLILEGHADRRGSVEYNDALSQRRVDRAKSFLVEHGVPEDHIETRALGKQHNLTDAEVRASIAGNPTLTSEERKRILRNERTIILASNRRVDVTLSTTGQSSLRQFPFNAADSLTLIGGREKPAAKKSTPAAKKPETRKAPARKK